VCVQDDSLGGGSLSRLNRSILLGLAFLVGLGVNSSVVVAGSPSGSSVGAFRSVGSLASGRIGALIYHGVATAFGDVESISGILDTLGISHHEVTSDELNQMRMEDLIQYKMIIWPGGYASQMSGSLEASTRERIREAVLNYGVSYVGICAGAFIAVSPAPVKGADGPEWGLSLISSETLPYYHLEDEGVDYALVQLELPQSKSTGVVWWGGPTFPEVPRGVVARYADRHEPAVIQSRAGLGWVVLSGPHPEAPPSWRAELGLPDSDGLDHELAAKLFKAAFDGRELSVI